MNNLTQAVNVARLFLDTVPVVTVHDIQQNVDVLLLLLHGLALTRHVHVEALRVQKNGGDHEEDQQQKNAVHQGCQVGLSLLADRIRMSLQVTWHDETQLASSSD